MTRNGYLEYSTIITMESKFYKVKFFGARSRREQLVQVKEVIQVRHSMTVEDALRLEGWGVIHNLKYREVLDE